MGYEVGMQAEILTLLTLFSDRVPDRETNAWVAELIADRAQWPRAHDLFDRIRKRLLVATGDAGHASVPADGMDRARVTQYGFEELCLKAIFNETPSKAPFDSCSPYWIAGSAIGLARAIGIPVEAVIAVIAPEA